MAIGQWNESVTDLIPGYRHAKRTLELAREKANKDDWKETLGLMIGNVSYALEHMETGRRPGNRRGIERRAAYQRERPMDPIMMQSFMQRSSSGSPGNITDSQRFQIEEALRTLSPMERECYELAYGGCYSHSEVAEMLNVQKGTVDKILQRANAKILENKATSLFLME